MAVTEKKSRAASSRRAFTVKPPPTEVMHRSFGPIPEQTFREAKEAPHGGATRIMRKVVPEFGRPKGDADGIRLYKATFERMRTQRASVFIEASSDDEADAMADDLELQSSDWVEAGDEDDDSVYIVEVTPSST